MTTIGPITTYIKPQASMLTRVQARGQSLLVGASRPTISVTQVATGLTGAPGGAGGSIAAMVSADAGNQLYIGSDSRLFVTSPQLASAQW